MKLPLSVIFLSLIITSNLLYSKVNSPYPLSDTQQVRDILDLMPDFIDEDIDSALVLLNRADDILHTLKKHYTFDYLPFELRIDYYKGKIYFYKGNLVRCLETVEEGIGDSIIQDYRLYYSNLYTVQGAVYAYRSDFIKAKRSFLNSLALDTSWRSQTTNYTNLGNIETEIQGMSQGIRYYKEALTILKKHDLPKTQVACLNNIARAWIRIDSLDRARANLEEASLLISKYPSQNQVNRILVYGQYAILNFLEGDALRGKLYLDSALSASAQSGNQILSLAVNIGYIKAIIKKDCKHPQLSKIIQSIEKAESTMPKVKRYNTNFWKGKLAYCAGDYQKAKQHYQAFLPKADRYYLKEDLFESYTMLADIYEKEGNITDALAITKVHFAAADSLSTIKNKEAIDNVTLEMDLEKANLEKSKIANELLYQERSAQLRSYLLLLAGGIIAVISLGAWYIFRQRNQILANSKVIERTSERLKQIISERNTLIKLISHDLRSHLMSIQLTSGALVAQIEQGDFQRDEMKKHLKEIEESAKSVNEFSHKIMESSQIDSSVLFNSQSNVNLNQQLEVLTKTHGLQASRKRINIDTAFLATEAEVYVDEDKLQLILGNLISNAIKFSPRESQIDVMLKDQGKAYEISVRDQGPGFKEEDFKNMFKRLKTLSARPTADEASLGMGLFLAKKLSKEIGVEIRIENHPDGGALARVLLSK